MAITTKISHTKCKRAISRAIRLCEDIGVLSKLKEAHWLLDRIVRAMPKPKRIVKGPREKSIKTLKGNLDRIHSIYTRLRHTDNNGLVRCITCGKPMAWRDSEEGHFIERQFTAVRWNDKNTHPQCKRCNWQLEGNHAVYEKKILELYGEATLTFLKASRRTRKWQRFELKALIDIYTQRVNKLSKEKGLPI